MDFIFFGLIGASQFVFRRRETRSVPSRSAESRWFRIAGHPYTIGLFVVICWLVVVNTVYEYPANTLPVMGILALWVPVYALWERRKLDTE
jgi:hypothetical protein